MGGCESRQSIFGPTDVYVSRLVDELGHALRGGATNEYVPVPNATPARPFDLVHGYQKRLDWLGGPRVAMAVHEADQRPTLDQATSKFVHRD